jgi:hypothetical protein
MEYEPCTRYDGQEDTSDRLCQFSIVHLRADEKFRYRESKEATNKVARLGSIYIHSWHDFDRYARD